MVGGSRKLGRGGTGGNRSIHGPPIKHPSSSTRLSMGGGASRPRGGTPSSSAVAADESFSLERQNPLNCAMAIKLTPDLVDEIRRVEAQGSSARIKFGGYQNSTEGNVIVLGDKSFKFSWSNDPVLCDIYEERRSGKDGNGLLVESGTSSRKLSVQRELNESMQNQVKRRSEEAERQSKSRKAICLDPQNSSMKNQAKALTVVESNQRRSFMNKKEPPSRKPSAAGPQKPIHKPGLSTTATPSKGKPLFGSPSSSQPEKYGASASPFTSGNLVKGNDTVADVTTTHKTSKTSMSDKAHSKQPSSASGNKSKNNRHKETKPSDLRSLIVSLLMESHSKGMSLKGLEKAVGNTIPCSAREIEPILKQIANYRPPGKYLLKEGMEMEMSNKPTLESGSSQFGHHRSPASQMFDQVSAQDATLSERTAVNDEEKAQLRSIPGHMSGNSEEVDIEHDSPDRMSNKRVSNNSEGLRGSSSSSGSDSDSESDGSDSGSDSRSKSSSGSESDASSSSKQVSDEDVDIMKSDDDNDIKDKLRSSDPLSTKSPFQSSHPDSEFVDIGGYEHVSDIVDIERDSPLDNNEAARSTSDNLFPNQESREFVEEIKSYPAEYNGNRERHAHDRKSYAEPDCGTHNSLKPGESSDHYRQSKSKSRRHSDYEDSDEMPENKRFKGENSTEPLLSMLFGETPDEAVQHPSTGVADETTVNFLSDDNNDHSSEAGVNGGFSAKLAFDQHQPIQRSFEVGGKPEAQSIGTKSGRRESSGRGVKNSESSLQSKEDGFSVDRNMNLTAEGIGDRHATLSEAHHRKPEMHVADPRFSSGYITKETNSIASDKSPVMNGRGRILQRENSDLELGEFREPNTDEIPVPRKQFERKGSFRQLENRLTDSDSSRKRPSNKHADSRKLSAPTSEALASGFRDGPSKKKVLDHNADDHTRTHNRATPPLTQQQQFSGLHTEVASEINRFSEMSSKSRYPEAGKDQGARTNTSRIVANNAAEQQHDPIQAVVPLSSKESKKQKMSKASESHRRKDAPLTGSVDGGQRRRESSSDENSCSYTKYEKEEPELKGPIRNVSQYREYVKEYQEKYEAYRSLNKILESDRDKFNNFGKDLETYRDRDRKKYHDILGQMKSSFHQCGEKHKRFKKIFVVLYEELKNLKQMIKDFAASHTKDGGS